MLRSLIPLLIIGITIGIAGWLVFMWAVRSGQFDDIEGPKYRMLDDEEEKAEGETSRLEGGADVEDKEGTDKV